MECIVLKFLLILAVTVPLSSAVTHSLQYFYTAVTPGINFPEFTVVGQVNGEQIDYYDSDIRRDIPKAEWMKRVVADDADYWNRETQILQGSQEVFKANVATVMQQFNHTKGVHTVQWMYGCELDDDGTKRGYIQYGYDGEDYISLDLNTETWIAPVNQAVLSKQRLDSPGSVHIKVAYLENTCIDWLQTYVGYGKDTLKRKVPPAVSLFQRDSSSPVKKHTVVCHATGFFPRAVMISWKKNGEDVYEDVELRETLPNNDGTFQKRSILTVSPEELNKHTYTCVVQHSSLEEELVLKLSDRRVLSGVGVVAVGVIVGAVVAVLLLVIITCVGVIIWKKKSGFKPVPDYRPAQHSKTNSSTSISSSGSGDSGSKLISD